MNVDVSWANGKGRLYHMLTSSLIDCFEMYFRSLEKDRLE